MRLGTLAIVSLIAGACTAAVVSPPKAASPPEVSQPVHFIPKHVEKPAGKVDPEVETRLELMEQELRRWRSDLGLIPKGDAADK